MFWKKRIDELEKELADERARSTIVTIECLDKSECNRKFKALEAEIERLKTKKPD